MALVVTDVGDSRSRVPTNGARWTLFSHGGLSDGGGVGGIDGRLGMYSAAAACKGRCRSKARAFGRGRLQGCFGARSRTGDSGEATSEPQVDPANSGLVQLVGVAAILSPGWANV